MIEQTAPTSRHEGKNPDRLARANRLLEELVEEIVVAGCWGEGRITLTVQDGRIKNVMKAVERKYI